MKAAILRKIRAAPFGKLSAPLQVLAVAVALFWIASSASAAPFVYVATLGPNGSQFGVVDLATGGFSTIGPPASDTLGNLVWWEGSLLSLTASGDLVKVDPVTGQITVIGATGLGFNAFTFAEVRGKLYATDFSNNIYSVDPQTAATAFIRATGMPPDPSVPFTTNADGTFNLSDETFYGVGGKLYVTFDSFNVDPGTLVIDENPADATVSPALYQIDPLTGSATPVGPTNLGLGASVEVNGKFYAFKAVITGFAGFPEAFSELVTLDLTTGKTTFIRNIDSAAGVILGAAPVRGPR